MREAAIQKRADILQQVEMFAKVAGYPPTVRELATNCGISPTTAQKYIKELVKEGVLLHNPGQSRSLRIA